MKSLSILSALALTAGLATTSFGQLYSEDFTGQNLKGVVGDGSAPTSDFGGVSWDVSGDLSGITATSDYFQVQNEEMVIRDIDGAATWASPSFSVASESAVAVSIDLGASGDFEISNDSFNILYSFDGGSTTALFTGIVDEIAAGDPMTVNSIALSATLQTFSSSVATGGATNMQIFVEAFNGAGSEFFYFDNVNVAVVPEPSALSLLVGFIGMSFVLIRRRRA